MAPRIIALNNVAISQSGVLYTLFGLPTDKPVLAHLLIHPGLCASGSQLAIIATGSDQPIRALPGGSFGNGQGFVGDAGSHFDIAIPNIANVSLGAVLVPSHNGQVHLRRAGDYQNSVSQTNVFLLGYFEALTVEYA